MMMTMEGMMDKGVVDDIIQRLLEGKGGKQVQLSEAEIRQLCVNARSIFLSEPSLLQLHAPIRICGDIHGQYHDLLRLFENGGYPPASNYLFLGDYVDRGKQSLETICLLLAYKIRYPDKVSLLRGNHEDAKINRIYGFYDECKRRFNVRLWKIFTDCFNCLPVSAIIDEKILCMHGGLSPELKHIDQIREIPRPTDIPDNGLLCDLLWSDPDPRIRGWADSDRGVSYAFGPDVVAEFLKKHDLDLICRGHQVVEDGYEFFAKRKLLTIFSAPNYGGEFDNAGALLSVDESLVCSFDILQSLSTNSKVPLKKVHYTHYLLVPLEFSIPLRFSFVRVFGINSSPKSELFDSASVNAPKGLLIMRMQVQLNAFFVHGFCWLILHTDPQCHGFTEELATECTNFFLLV